MELPFVISILIAWNLARSHVPVKQPTFKNLSADLGVLENKTVFLPCVVEDLGESFVRWWKDESLLSDLSEATLQRFTVMSDGLAIRPVKAEDTGEYACEVVRPKPWSSLKQTHKVKVLYPPKILQNPSDGYVEVILGEKVRIECLAKGMPPPVVSWIGKSFTMPSSEENKQILEFTATTHLLSGIYQCEANNRIGDPVHATFILRVLHKPEVTVEKSWIHSAPGIKTALICEIVADPEAQEVKWLFNGDNLSPLPPRVTYKVKKNHHVLQFKSVTASDFGNYTCRAANRLGESQAFMELSGVPNPVVFKKIEEKSAGEFILIWEVDSISPIFDYKLSFRKEGEDRWASFIIPADSSSSGPLHSKSYTFSGLDKFSGYEAKIHARNRFGWSESSEVVAFGFMKPSEVKEEVTNEVFWISESTNSVARSSPHVPLLGFVLWMFRLFPSICDI